ncbi:MAG: GTP-binding protein [Burkholderiales bacterium PBB1]|nr:MAG: GTP-binding protein [Burkholderiales bacterium PBB1]
MAGHALRRDTGRRHSRARGRAPGPAARRCTVTDAPRSARKPIPVTVLTGHLGSGKTTLLQRALEHPLLQRTALIINEFGEVSIDHLMVAQLAENIVQLRGGCICCAVRVDLAMTLRDLHHKRQLGEIPAFDHVIIETSGLADPVPILHTMMANPMMQKHYAPDAVVTCVDQINLERTLQDDAVALSQLQMADVVILTKGDLATPEQRERSRALVHEANPHARQMQVTQGDADASTIFLRGLFEAGRTLQPAGGASGWLMAGQPMRHGTPRDDTGTDPSVHRGPRPTTHVIHTDTPVDLVGLGVFLNRVTNTMSDRILRIKGIVNVASRPRHVTTQGPLVVHAVREKFYPLQWMPDWPDDDRSTRLVFIGRDLDSDWIDALFGGLCLLPEKGR